MFIVWDQETSIPKNSCMEMCSCHKCIVEKSWFFDKKSWLCYTQPKTFDVSDDDAKLENVFLIWCSKWVKIAKNQKMKKFLLFLLKYTFPHRHQLVGNRLRSLNWGLVTTWESVYQKKQKMFHFLVFCDFHPFRASKTNFQVLHPHQHKIWQKFFWFLHQHFSKSGTKLQVNFFLPLFWVLDHLCTAKGRLYIEKSRFSTVHLWQLHTPMQKFFFHEVS